MTNRNTANYSQRSVFDFPRRWTVNNVQTTSIIIIFIALVVFFSILSPNFFVPQNLNNLGRQIAPTVIAATAMTFVITAGGIDLSIGSLSAVCGASLGVLSSQFDPAVSVLLVLVVGLASGLIVGYLSSYNDIHPFIVTLAGLTGLRGLAQLITGGYSNPISSPFLEFLGQGTFASIYMPIWFAVIATVIAWYVYGSTRFGRYVKATGSNQESARRVGINTRRIKMLTLLVSGFTAAIAGILVSTRLGSGSSNIGVAFELEVITAVVLGGTDLFGGRGSILGAIFGALTLGVLRNGLVIIGLDVYWVPILQGIILLVAILINSKVFSRIRHTN